MRSKVFMNITSRGLLPRSMLKGDDVMGSCFSRFLALLDSGIYIPLVLVQ